MNIRTLCFAFVLTSAGFAQAPYPGNDSDHGVTRPQPLGEIVYPYTGNFSFSTRDLTVVGAVGKLGLAWSRDANSRTPLTQAFFGGGHNWTHSWQWEMVDAGQDAEGRPVVSVREPAGWVHRFSETSPGAWWSAPSVRDRLISTGDDFRLLRFDASEVRFVRRQAVGGVEYLATRVIDPEGNEYALTYTDGSLSQITEPAGRWLKVSYASLPVPNNPTAPPFKVISHVTASDGQNVSYHYEFIGGAAYPVLAGVTYPDSAKASYSYAAPRDGSRVLLTRASDPRGPQAIRGRVFGYRTQPDAAAGQAAEVATEEGSVLAALSADAKGPRSYSSRRSNGAVVVRTYAPGGNVIEEIDALGFAKRYDYDAAGRGFLVATTDELGRITRRENDATGMAVKQTWPDGSISKWQRDSLGRLLSETDESGLTRTFLRDAKGRVTKIIQPDGTTRETTYNGYGQPTSIVMPTGATTRMTYDSRGLLVSTVDALGNETSYGYDAQDRRNRITDPLGNTTRYEYNAAGLLVATLYADKSKVTTDYNEHGQATRITDAAGAVRTMTYDAFGRLVSEIDALGRVTERVYAEPGKGNTPFDQPMTAVSATGRINRTSFDANGRVVARTFGAGTREAATVRYSYDPTGRPASLTDPRGKTVQFFYDERGRRVRAKDALNSSTTFGYDRSGRRIEVTDARGKTTRWTYDAMGRELTKTDALGQVTTRRYDSGGNLTELTDAKGNTHRFEYDLLARPITLAYPDGSRERFAFDAAGNRTSQTNRAGRSRTFAYDARNREISSAWNDGGQTISKAYDAAGRMIVEDNGVSRLTFEYDAAGRLVAETQDLSSSITNGQVDPAPRTVRYAYDADGRKASLTYPDGSTVRYAYNPRGQMAEIVDGDRHVASYEYDLAGNAVRMPRGNSTETAHDFDDVNRITGIVDQDPVRASVNELEYVYDEVGNRTARSATENASVRTRDTYLYDATQQVTGADYGASVTGSGASVPASTVRFVYDSVGNRLQTDVDGVVTRYSVNNLNQYVQVGAFAPGYDRNGNLASMGEWLYEYDAINRLVLATNGKTTARFFYDAQNRCVARSYNGATAFNYYDRWNLIEERSTAGGRLARYVHGRRTDEVLLIANASGSFYPHHDALGNVVFITDAAGKVVERYSYSVEGKLSIRAANGQTIEASTIGNRWAFTGREWLADIGLYDYRNRVYSAQLARFLQNDPIRFSAGDVNLYRYVSNAFSIRTDPDGLKENLNLFPTNENIHNYANAGSLTPDVYTVGGHGNASGVYDASGNLLSAQALANIINADPNYTPGTPVVLNSCNVGDGSYGEQLSDILNVDVAAPDSLVWYYSDGSKTLDPGGGYVDNEYHWWEAVWDWIVSLFE